ncbi:MAG: ATP-binding protein [Fusobacterium perfoetens]|uniref:AAA family ATPase n=1 Tax=Fusobacterium perfoetens TaxID=852 RepID=UPI0023F299D9|nr:ATP-binding protein [Fusobacterium perfoetens]MCI6151966.1 ATP-binding protein [Fusobacterium perfoetens]MDY3237879.1 ATP-binding protein [Fusobacterium perfoetens]
MLKEFNFKNFKSFKDETSLSLEAMNFSNDNLDCFNIKEIKNTRLLKSVAIYGHNSYGKTNIFKALSKMLEIIKFCINSDYTINVDNFKLDNYSKNESTKFELVFIMNEITFRYGFEVFENHISKEWLYKKILRETRIFERTASNNSNIILNSKYSQYGKYVKFTKDTELFLSSMEKNNISGEIRDIYNFITKNIHIFSAELMPNITSRMLLDNFIDKNALLETLKKADLNIFNINIKKEEKKFDELPELLKSIIKENKIPNESLFNIEEFITHPVFSKNKDIIGNIDFNLQENESEGTKKLYYLMGPILKTLEQGNVIFIDELDSKLHHLIIKLIIELFNSIDKNKNNAQLIFNTHDFYLLKEDLFRKDQVYFVDKDEFGISSLYSLADFKGIEKKTNLLTHYLLGNFGSLGKVNVIK